MFDVENVGYLAQKNNAKTVDMHEYNETVRDLCKMTIGRLTGTKVNVNI